MIWKMLKKIKLRLMPEKVRVKITDVATVEPPTPVFSNDMKKTLVIEEELTGTRLFRKKNGTRILQKLWKISDGEPKQPTFVKVEWRDVPEVYE